LSVDRQQRERVQPRALADSSAQREERAPRVALAQLQAPSAVALAQGPVRESRRTPQTSMP